jgi:hypothetical protein
MKILKKAYFQGTEEPKPGQTQYPPDPAVVIQPRFKEPFYRNYDLTDPGLDQEPVNSPGIGWHSMHNFKSIQDFLKARREHLKNKYIAQDEYIRDGKGNRKERIEKIMVKADQFLNMVKVGIDFSTDQQVSPLMGWDGGSVSDAVNIGGFTDQYTQPQDFGGKGNWTLNYGKDLDTETIDQTPYHPNIEKLHQLIDAYLNLIPNSDEPNSLPDGILPEDDLTMPNNQNGQYGTTDLGNTSLDQAWFVA